MLEKIKELYMKYKEIINYLFFGGCAAVVNFVAYFIPARIIGIDVTLSNGIAWVAAVIFAYVTNKLFVFESKDKTKKENIKEMVSFFLGRAFTGLTCDIGLFSLMAKVLMLNDIIAKIVSQVVVVVLNYLISKLIVFKDKNAKEEVK